MLSNFKYPARDAKDSAAAVRLKNDAPGGCLGTDPRGTVPMSSKTAAEHKASVRLWSVAAQLTRQLVDCSARWSA
jgi:hypothetical protein